MTLEERSGTPAEDTSPFDDKSIRRLLVFCGHHRAGSTWLTHVLFAVADRYGLTYQKCEQKELSPAADAFFQDHSLIDRAALPPYRGAHLIRDPRDIVVSGYFYHLWTEEKWAHVSKRELGGKSYLEYLNSLSKEEGLLVEMMRFANYDLRHMVAWDYQDPNFIEIRYENLIADEIGEFRRLFRHFGFSQVAIETSLGLARVFSFERQAHRKIGQVQTGAHLRCGLTGQWRNVFGNRHRRLAKELLGTALIKLGYESSLDWT